MKKFLLVFAVLMLVGMGNLFAEESPSTGYIKPTYNLGFVSTSFEDVSEILTAIGLEVDFVAANGLTFGIQNILAWETDFGLFNMINFGIGYTYNADGWCVGGKLMTLPHEFMDGGMGISVNGTYWFWENIGFTGIMDAGFGVGAYSWSTFSLRVGISAKF